MSSHFDLASEHENWKVFLITIYRAPTQTGKPGKMGRHFQSGKSRGNFGTDWKSQGKSHKNTGKFREFQTNIIWFLVIFQINYVLFAKMDHQVFS